ncbi:MAG: hypothetical protein ACRDNS_19250, partial [Trebonia sp.]
GHPLDPRTGLAGYGVLAQKPPGACAGPLMTDLHGHQHHSRQRMVALVLVTAGLCRAASWLTLIGMYFLGVTFIHSLFQDVWFVAILSLYANAATDFGQACASLAQLTAARAHEDAEAGRRGGDPR